MSYFIILRGPLGVGKSTIGKALAKKIDAKYISIDKKLEKLKLDKVEGEYIPAKNFIKAQENFLPEAKKALDAKRIVIFDGNFYHKEQIIHLTKKLKFKHHIITLKASLKTCTARDSKRKKVHGKWAAMAVYNLVSRFSAGKSIDTEDKTAAETVKKIQTILEPK